MEETMKSFEAEINNSFRNISEGDIITGTIIDVNEEELVIDLSYFTQGIIKAADLSEDPSFSILDMRIGSEITAIVKSTDDGHGNILLSRVEADKALSWDVLMGYRDDESVHTVKIVDTVAAGAIAYLEGIRGFIPASQLSSEYVEDTAPFKGKSLDVKVTDVNVNKEKLILSAKAVLKEQQKEAYNHKVAMIVPGTVTEGTVESLQNYGVFVNIGDGMSGLVHISQICDKRIKHPKEVLKEGQKVKVKVLNTNDGKISLSIKACEENAAVDEEEELDVSKYIDSESVGTSLGSLFANLKF